MNEKPNRKYWGMDIKMKKTKKTIKLVAWVIPPLVFIYFPIVIYFSYHYWDNKNPLVVLDQLGSWFGGLFGSLFGLITIIFLLVQNEEQKKEFKSQLEAQEKQIRDQKYQAMKQSFENTFFQLISLHNNIVNDIEISQQQGREAFRFFYNKFCSIFRESFGEYITSDHPYPYRRHEINQTYSKFYDEYQIFVGQYYDNLYIIIKLVHETEFRDDNERKIYFDIIRAQLSTFELIMLLYTALSESGDNVGEKKFLPLVSQYEFFSNLRFASAPVEADYQLYQKVIYENESSPTV